MDKIHFIKHLGLLVLVIYCLGLVSVSSSRSYSRNIFEYGTISGSFREPYDSRSNGEFGYNTVSVGAGRVSDNGNSGVLSESINTSPGFNNGQHIPDRISKYISYEEATYSPTAKRFGIKNTPNDVQLSVMKFLGITFFDDLRSHFDSPLYITSFFRSRALNEKLGGAFYSEHMVLNDVAAIDIDMDGKRGPTNNQLFHHIKNNEKFYKLIAEFPVNGKLAWVHISFSTDLSKNNSRLIYIAVRNKNRTIYLPYNNNAFLVK